MTGAGSGGQAPPDGMDAEEAEKCPICLGVLAGGELAMPDSCCHVFCLSCLLTWAELQVAPSCPVDRRPFTNVYRWDGDLSCVQVSVKRQTSEHKSESCCCKKPEQKVCVKKKPARRIQLQKGETMADTKSKGLVRKCNEEESSSLSRKKRRGIECCVWSPSSCVSITASTQDVVWVTEDIPSDTGLKECKAQVQECPWLSLVSPADGILRQHFNPVSWNRSSFSFGHPPSPFSSSTPFGPDHFVFQGVVCAITCPKGGEKRGGRASTSKAPTKEAESLPSRRSGRNSKTQEETPLSDASSPPQSSSSDCDSSTNQSTKTGKASQMPARRKGKQVTNRKASGKRKATTRKKCSPEVVSSSSASEEEGGSDDGVEKETKTAQNPSSCEQEPIDAEESLNADQNDSADEQGGVDSLRNSVAQDSGSDTQEQSNEHAEEDKTDHQHHEFSCPEHSAANSPGSWSGGNQSKEPASPISSRSKDSDERNSPVPSDSHSPLMENLMSPHRNKQTEQDDNMDICTESEEANSEHSSREMKAESFENLAQPSFPSPGKLEENVADPDANSCEGTNVKALGSQESLVGEGMKDDGLSKDDIKVVPMDCSSPMSEHGKSPLLEPPNDSVDAAATGPLPSAQPPAKDGSSKPQEEREKSQERKNGRQRRSRFHSPTSTWSPKRESKRDSPRHSKSRSRERDSSPPSSHSSRARSRERGRDRDGDRNHSRRDRSRERRRWRSRSRSRSRSHSRSRSRSRTRSYRRGPSPEPASREHSPHRKERRGGWRSGQGSGFGGEGRRYHGGAGRFENGVPSEKSPDRQGWSDNPDWVTEKTSGEPESRNRESGSSRWEDHRSSGGSRTEPRGRGGRGGFEGGRGAGRGGGSRSFYSQQEETSDSRWQTRNNYSGTSNNSGNDSYSRFNENRAGSRRKESEQGDSMLDRSGWSSASSWAVRRTLPADVQDYYSKRERGGPGGWNRQEEEQQPAGGDPTKSEPQSQAVPGNAPVPVMSVIPPQLNVLPHHYPVQGPRGALPVTLQPAAPYAMPPQVPVHHHPAVPLLQMPAVGAQGLPPPPPPPPPMQQGSQTVAAHSEGHITQMGTNIVGYGKPALLPTLTKAGITAATQGQPAPSQVLPSSTTQPGHNKAQADSSKKEKKQQIQEKAINEVKTAIKPFYQKKEITKEEYKEIVRKAVEKVCHSKSGEVNSSKVANLVKAYVDKYKHARKK